MVTRTAHVRFTNWMTGPRCAEAAEADGLVAADAVCHREARRPLEVVSSVLQSSMADLASRIVGVRGPELDETLVHGLRVLVRVLQVDWALLRRPASGASPSAQHSWRNGGDTPMPDALLGVPALAAAIERGGAAAVEVADLPPSDARRALADIGIGYAAVVSVPLGSGNRGMLAFGSAAPNRQWSSAVFTTLRLVAAMFGQALACQDVLSSLTGELHEARPEPQPRRRLGREPRGHRGLVVGSVVFDRVLEQVRTVASTDSTVLIIGETGTGKEMLAEQIHELSGRRAREMVRVNCAALPSTLLESELFGREKGAYTGADSSRAGRFELASGSTLFLDEIGDLPMDAQVKLLRVLEQKQIERLGSPRPIRVDTRVIAATHRNLERLVADGTFRPDLFYRLNVFPVGVPALRERPEDIPSLVWHFIDEFASALRKQIVSIPDENMASLVQYGWPGNVRELRNVVERAVILSRGPVLTIELPRKTPTFLRRAADRRDGNARGPLESLVTLADVERAHIRQVLERTGWRVRGEGGAAAQLGLRPTTLETRMAKLGLSRSV